MSRIRAEDYEDKRNNILNIASTLFAEHGYMGAKMEQIAENCGVSKSMLYHYFKKKEDVLFAILQVHVARLIDLVESHLKAEGKLSTEEFFRKFVQLWLEPSAVVRARHVVGMVEMRHLTAAQKTKQIKLEKKLLELVGNVLERINNRVGPDDRRIYSLLLIGMMNWVELWYNQAGSISPDELYKMVGRLFLDGFISAKGKSLAGLKIV